MSYSKSLFFCVLFSVLGQAVIAQKIITIGREDSRSSGPFTLEGSVVDFESGEPMLGASVVIERQNLGVSADLNGNFSFQLYKGVYTIKVSSVGFKTKSRTFSIVGDGRLRFVLEPESFELAEVVVTEKSRKEELFQSAGTELLSIEKLKSLPPLAGEVDIIKSLTLLSGVATQGEVSNNFSVRGGGGDQNLFLLNGVTIYNPSHLLGFFSSINSDVISQVKFYKGTVPAEFGGRASSVIDIKTRKGNFGQYNGNASLGLVSSSLSVGGPIIKEKLSFFASGRYAYPRWLIRQANDPNIRESEAGFWDGNFITNYIINDNNDLEFSYYRSSDEFVFSNDLENDWSNQAANFAWNSVFSEKLSGRLNVSNAIYKAGLRQGGEISQSDFDSELNQSKIGLKLDYEQSSKLSIAVGGEYSLLENNRGDFRSFTQGQLVEEILIEEERALEGGLFAQAELSITRDIGLSLGLRYSTFALLGGGTYNTYESTSSRSLSTVTGTNEFDDSETVSSFSNLEPRITGRIKSRIVDFTIGASRNVQYLHLISNTTTSAPNDIWKFSDPFLNPQVVWQYSVGFAKDLKNQGLTVTVDAYYKDLQNLVEYKDGADLVANPTIETEVFNIIGEAYGIEVGLEKNVGKLKGNMNYTFSRTKRISKSPFLEEQINRGRIYPANLDVPHVGKASLNYRISPVTTLNGTFTFSSGRLFNSPLGKFEYEGTDFPFFLDRNNDRTRNIHRLDLALNFNIQGTGLLGNGELTFAIYNVYGQANPFSAFFQDFQGSPPGLYQLTIIDSPFPSVSYAIEF